MSPEWFAALMIFMLAFPLVMFLYFSYKERQSEINYYRERNRK